jgi:putative acetyltransferase
MSITFRNIEQKDNLPLSQLIKATFREFRIDMPGTVYTDPTTDDLYTLFQTPRSEYWVAEDNGTVIGGCGIYPTDGLPEGCVELVKFFLTTTARGKGTGKYLMDKATGSARRLGFKQIYLETFPQLGKAVGMYEKAGYKPLTKAMGNSGHFACTIWMLKDL